jgi:hypothetical protein
MVELVDTSDLKSDGFGRVSSSLTICINKYGGIGRHTRLRT